MGFYVSRPRRGASVLTPSSRLVSIRTNAGELPTPVLMIQDVSFAYPNSEPLYHNLDLGIDLQSRIALVGPNGAGKTTFVKLMTGELQPTSVTQRGFLQFLNLNFASMASSRCRTASMPSS